MAIEDRNNNLHSEKNGQFISKSASELKEELQQELPTTKKDTKKLTPAEKIASVHIDFSRDNILPELNEEDLRKVGAKENKPVLLKKSIIDRNTQRHNDVMPDTEKILTQTLYSPLEIFRGNIEKPYYTFVKPLRISNRNGKNEYGIVLLDVDTRKDNFEIVHWHWVNEDKFDSIKK